MRLAVILPACVILCGFQQGRNVAQANVDHFSVLVNWATTAVAIGVALESVELIHDFAAWIKRWRFKRKELAILKEIAAIFPVGQAVVREKSNADHPMWVKWCTRLGLILIAVGVVGEAKYGAKLEDAHDAVHQFDITEIVQLEKAVSPRRLTGEQKNELANFLKQYPDPVGVIVVSAFLDNESSDFADDFNSAIHDGAHWQTLRIRDRLTKKTGISLGVLEGTPEFDPWKRRISDLGNRIGKALTAIGLQYNDVTFGADDVHSTSVEFKPGPIYLVIEHKPQIAIQTGEYSNR